jgi:hypothetical protein
VIILVDRVSKLTSQIICNCQMSCRPSSALQNVVIGSQIVMQVDGAGYQRPFIFQRTVTFEPPNVRCRRIKKLIGLVPGICHRNLSAVGRFV